MNEEQLRNARQYLHQVRKEVEGLAAAGSPQSAAWYAKALSALQEIENQADTALVLLYQSLRGNPALPELPAMLSNSKQSLNMLHSVPVKGIHTTTCGFNNTLFRQDINCSQDNCGTYPSEVDVAIAELVAATLDLAAAIAEAAKVVIPETIAGFTNPAYIVAAAIEAGLTVDARIADEAAAALQIDAAKIQNCLQDYYNAMLRGICASVNIIRQTVERIEAKVDYLIVLAEYIKKTVDIISLRQIEESLASCTVLVSLYLPKAFGGHLETVVQLVEQLIDQSQAAGLPTCDAQSFFHLGQEAMTSGNFKKAYLWFAEAYQQLLCCQ